MKLEPYALPAAHKALMDLARSLNAKSTAESMASALLSS
jgi:hypothetical protein